MPHRAAVGLIVLGLIGVLWGVFHVLESANGPGPGPRSFAERRSYNQVKESIHASFLGGCLRAGAGGILIYIGARAAEARKRNPGPR